MDATQDLGQATVEVWAYGPKYGSGKGWVAKILGTDSRYRFEREFVEPIRGDRREQIFALGDGLYEVCSYSGSSPVKYFLEVAGGQGNRVEAAAVEARFPASPKLPPPVADPRPAQNDSLDPLEAEALRGPGAEAERFG